MVWLERHFQQALGQVTTVLQNIVLFFLSCLPFCITMGCKRKRHQPQAGTRDKVCRD